MVNLLIGVPVETFLGLALLSAARSAAPMYSLASTHAGGGILWVGAEIFTWWLHPGVHLVDARPGA